MTFDWTMMLQESFASIGQGIIEFLPRLLVAIVLVIIGYIIAVALGRVIAQIIRSIKVDSALRSTGLDELLHRGGFKLDTGRFIGEIVKWFVIFVFLIPAFQVMGLTTINVFIQRIVIDVIPQVISAVIILVVAALVAQFLQRVVVGAAKAARIKSAGFVGSVTKWSIWVLGILAALVQLGIATVFIQTAYTGVIIALAIAVGLAFGLGGQEVARDILHKVRKEISNNE